MKVWRQHPNHSLPTRGGSARFILHTTPDRLTASGMTGLNNDLALWGIPSASSTQYRPA